MDYAQLIHANKDILRFIPRGLLSDYKSIATNPEIHGGQPHIKGTRILALDVLLGQLQGYSLDKMILEFKEMGVKVKKDQMIEARQFSIDWLHSLNEKKAAKTSK